MRTRSPAPSTPLHAYCLMLLGETTTDQFAVRASFKKAACLLWDKESTQITDEAVLTADRRKLSIHFVIAVRSRLDYFEHGKSIINTFLFNFF